MLLFLRRERIREALVGAEGGFDQRGMHPKHQVGVGGRIPSSGRKAAELYGCLAVDTGVDVLHGFTRSFCLRLRAVGGQVEG
jgi:hypothetical protein